VYCKDCTRLIRQGSEKAIGSGEWETVLVDETGAWVCPTTGDEHAPLAVNPALVREAAGLASEHGENPEYDRALVELVIRMTPDASHDQHTEIVRRMIGVRV
jgi:hypothetical protein